MDFEPNEGFFEEEEGCISDTTFSVEDVEVDEALVKLEHIENKSNELEKCVLAVDKERKKLNEEEIPLFHSSLDKV